MSITSPSWLPLSTFFFKDRKAAVISWISIFGSSPVRRCNFLIRKFPRRGRDRWSAILLLKHPMSRILAGAGQTYAATTAPHSQQQPDSSAFNVDDFPALGSGTKEFGSFVPSTGHMVNGNSSRVLGTMVTPIGPVKRPSGVLQSNSATASPGSTTSSQPSQGVTLPCGTSKYGLHALGDLLRIVSADGAPSLGAGHDLTTFGLNLDSRIPLHATFMSPFADVPNLGTPEPQFNLPDCYSFLVPPAISKVNSLSEEALFYCFYVCTRDSIQEAAAQELYNRGWRFHKLIRMWITHDPSPEAQQASVKSDICERGLFIFFDPQAWAKMKKEWIVYYEHVEERATITRPNGIGPAPGIATAPSTPGSSVSAGTKQHPMLQRQWPAPGELLSSSPTNSQQPNLSAGR